MFNFFDNLLPDNREIRERIAKRYQTDSLQPFDLLYEIGRDCVGALILQPPQDAIQNVEQIKSEILDAQEQDRESFMCSHILFWLLAASDGHAKNYTVTVLPGGGVSIPLTPDEKAIVEQDVELIDMECNKNIAPFR